MTTATRINLDSSGNGGSVALTSRVVANGDVMASRLGGETVLLNLATETYFGMDDVGTAMWEAVTTSEDINAAIERLATQFDVELPRLTTDVSNFVSSLVNHGLVQVR